MLAYGFDAAERDGVLRFAMRGARVAAVVGADDLAEADGLAGVEITRAPAPELVGRVRLSHVAAGGDHATATAEATLPGQSQTTVSDSELPLVLTRGEGLDVAERWLAESGVARDRLRLALPPSQARLAAITRLPAHRSRDRRSADRRAAAAAPRARPAPPRRRASPRRTRNVRRA